MVRGFYIIEILPQDGGRNPFVKIYHLKEDWVVN